MSLDRFATVPKGFKVDVATGGTVPVGKIGFKAAGGKVVKCLITGSGVRPWYNGHGFSYVGKFRVRSVMVMGIIDRNGKLHNSASTNKRGGHGGRFVYRVGESKRPNGFTTNLNEDCGQGIHLFPDFDKAAALAGWSR